MFVEESGVLEYEGSVVLEWKVTVPPLLGTKKGQKRLQRYYHRVISLWKQRWTGEVYGLACASESNLPWKLSLEGEVIDLGDGRCSIGITVVEQPRKKEIFFFGDLWEDGIPLSPKKQVPFLGRKRHEIIAKLQRQGEKREDFMFHGDYFHGLERYFSYQNTFFQEEGVEVFYGQGVIANQIEGVPKFFLPYSW